MLLLMLVACNAGPTRDAADQTSGARVWLRQWGSSSDDAARGVDADSRGYVYVAGETSGGLDGTVGGRSDAYLTKYDPAGNRVWVRQLGSSERDSANGISADRQGNVYVAGLTFGRLAETYEGSYDAFLVKYDTDGHRLWSAQLGTDGGDYASSISTDSAGNAYIAGDTFGSLGAPNAGVADAYLAKYDKDGNRRWIRQLGSPAGDVARSICTDSQGDIYIAGQTDGDLDGANAGDSDAFLAKYDTDGNLLWIRQLGSASLDYANGVSTAPGGNVLIAGLTNGSLDGSNAGEADLFLAKYDVNGNRLWVRQMGSSAVDYANGAAADSSGHVYVAGITLGSLDGASAGQSDAFLAKYDTNGKLLWTKHLGDTKTDGAIAVSVREVGNIYIVGLTNGSLDGTNMGGFDAFLAKYK